MKSPGAGPVRPGDAERRGAGGAAARRASGSGGGSVRSTPTPARSISRAARHAGEQRDLRVPVLDRQRRAEARPSSRRRRGTTSCVGSRSSIAPRSRPRAGSSPPTSRSSSSGRRRARVERRLHGRVVELGAAAHPRPAQSTAASSPSASRSTVHSTRRAHAGRAAGSPRPRTARGGCSGVRRPGSRASGRGGGPRRRARRRARRTRRRRRSRSARGSRRRGARQWNAWSRSRAPGGSIVTNGRSLASSSGSAGRRRARSASASTVGRELLGDPRLAAHRGEVERSGHLQHASHAVTLARGTVARGGCGWGRAHRLSHIPDEEPGRTGPV